MDDKIIDRIRKLLALGSNNPNEHEAKIAMERAHRLLAAYNLSLSDITAQEARDADPYSRGDYHWKHDVPATRKIASAIAKLYFCKMFYSRGYGGAQYSFVGRTTNVEIAKMVSQHVIGVINKLALAGANLPHNRGTGYCTNFRNAAAHRIYERCEELIRQSSEGQLKTEGGTNLPALRNTYLAEQQGALDYLQKQGVKVISVRSGARGSDRGRNGFDEGRQAGDRVSLRPGVATPSRQSLTKE